MKVMQATGSHEGMRQTWHLPVLIGVSIASLWFGWVGFIASDDVFYWRGGLGWLHEFPYVADYFGTIRHPVVVPVAASFALLGDSEFALSLGTNLYFLGLVGSSYMFARRMVDTETSFLFALLVALTPLFSIQATIASADTTELFFIVLSLWLYIWAGQSTRPQVLLIASGAAAAGAWLTRETTLALLIFYGLLFIAGRDRPRAQYWIMGLGFLGIYTLEFVYFWVTTGNPLYRVEMVLKASSLADRIPATNLDIDDSGNIRLHAAVDPLLAVAANQEFGLLYYLALPAAVWVFLPGRGANPQRRLARLFVLFGIVAFVFAAYALRNIKLLPRYYSAASYAFLFAVVVWLRYSVFPRHPLPAKCVIVALVATNLLCIYVDNKNPRFAERALARFAASVTEPVYTDPETAYRSGVFLHWAGVKDRVIANPPTPGAFFFYDPKNARSASPRLPVESIPKFQPSPDWRPIERIELSRKLSGLFIEAIGLDRVLPAPIYRRLNQPVPPVTIYRVPGSN